MKQGGWVPMSKKALEWLPYDRKYSKVEALFSVQADFDNGNKVTVAGYSKLWGWSRTKVRTFLRDIGVDVEYEDNTGDKQNTTGQIKRQIKDQIKDRCGTDNIYRLQQLAPRKEQTKDRYRTDAGQIKKHY